jgi:hypothetical protein
MPKQQPSFSNGFARCAEESERPDLWDGLVGLWAPCLGNTSGKLFSLLPNGTTGSGTVPWAVDTHGVCSAFNASTYWTIPFASMCLPYYDFTIIAYINLLSTSGYPAIFGGNGSRFFEFPLSYNGNATPRAILNAGGSRVDFITYATMSTGNQVVGFRRQGAGVTFYGNGVYSGTNTSNAGIIAYTGSSFTPNRFASTYGSLNVYMIAIWNRALGDCDFRGTAGGLYVRDPYAILRPRARTSYLAPSGAAPPATNYKKRRMMMFAQAA